MSKTTTPSLVPDYSVMIGHRADPYRQENRVRLEIDVIPHQQMIGEALVRKGRHLVDVPASLVPEVQAQVVDKSKVKIAKERFERLEAKFKADHSGGELLSPHSVQSSYRSIFDEDMGYLASCKIVQEDLPPPMTAEERRAATVAANVAARSAPPANK